MNASEKIRDQVREGYAKVAENGPCAGGACCGGLPPDQLALKLGYENGELERLPEGANLGLSCGNPTALAELRAGEVVLDLGSGGGFDVFLAAEKVGPLGRAIGVDMTPEMLARARANAVTFRARMGYDNVEFRLGEIEHLPVENASVDVILSNCVLNLSPDKPQVWREIARVLKPGGRVAISDMALLRPLPEALRSSVEALVGCVAGALTLAEVDRLIRAVGLTALALEPRPGYVEAMLGSGDPLYREILSHLPDGHRASDYITSLSIAARKPASGKCCG
ncbi:MAG: arsenite S-adenosylmethyltransferase [Planctomycetota bacterium]